MIGIIGGTSLLDSTLCHDWPEKRIDTPYGSASLRVHEKAVFLQRHGNPPSPPHRINHRANIWALKSLGVEGVVAINSVGSLKPEIKPGSFLVPNDFLSFWLVSTFFDDEMKFMVPRMDADHAARLHARCEALRMPARLGGIYIQTQGPRLETVAEISMLKQFGDVVGMTMASEATLSMEQELPYASLCSIDNYCHGIAEPALTIDQIQEHVKENIRRVETLIRSLIPGDF